MKRNVYLFLLFVSSLGSLAQSPQENHSKYWYYRHRLINNFMLIGNCQGCSLPAFNRRKTGILDWGDGQDPGWYIAILATEYGLLKKTHQNTSGTIKELFYALQAINRLDYIAESDWRDFQGVHGQPDYNGFCIRDDVVDYRVKGINDDFVHNNYEHFNSSNVQTQLPPVTQALSIYGAHNQYGCCTEEMSQDNILYLLMGLSLINSYVDEDAVYIDDSGLKLFSRDYEASILREARNISYALVNYMKVHNWILKNPVTGNNVQEGADAVPFSYGFAEAYCKATNQTNTVDHALTGFDCGTFQDVISQSDIALWWALQTEVESRIPSNFISNITAMLAAIGNSWYVQAVPPILANSTELVLTTAFMTGSKADGSYDLEHLPLIRQVFHGGGNGIPDDTYKNLLNSAPCLGPWNFRNGNNGGYDWSTSNRFRNPESRGFINADEPEVGEYWGGDYMLLFNLYCLAHEDYYPSYINLMDNNIGVDFPLTICSGPCAGSGPCVGPFCQQIIIGKNFLPPFQFPYQGDFFDTITFSNKVAQDGDVTLHAGREIALLPGFGAKQGAEFGAFVRPFTCGSNAGIYNKTTGDTSKQHTLYDMHTLPAVYYADAGKNSSHPSVSTSSSFLTAPQLNSKSQNINITKEINITPNPSGGIFTLQLKEASGASDVFIYNDMGQEIYKMTDVRGHGSATLTTGMADGNTLTIDLSSYPKGIYFVKVQSADKVYTEKVVVQ